MSDTYTAWASRHPQAAAELQALALGGGVLPPHIQGTSEAAVQSAIRLEAPRCGVTLWRNNRGVAVNANGQPVRFGLANDSKQLGDRLKSSDLIGWRSVTVGDRRVAQFVSRECKPVGWRYTGTAREVAQLAWINLVNAAGGDACFATGTGTL